MKLLTDDTRFRFFRAWLLGTAMCVGLVLNTAPVFGADGVVPPPAGHFSGKVVETMDSGGYTYVCVDTGEAKLWAAAPRMKVSVGDTVAVGKAMPMRNFHSKSLDREFEVVYFTGETTVNGEPSQGAAPASGDLPKGHPPVSGGHGSSGGATKAAIDFSNLEKAKGGKTIEEILADPKTLAGKSVKVRGRVVKYNANILGKNWIHIQDGTGKNGGNDLTVTTSTEAKVGDTVLVSGKVTLDKDFGGGYRYDVILDDAKVTVE